MTTTHTLEKSIRDNPDIFRIIDDSLKTIDMCKLAVELKQENISHVPSRHYPHIDWFKEARRYNHHLLYLSTAQYMSIFTDEFYDALMLSAYYRAVANICKNCNKDDDFYAALAILQSIGRPVLRQ